MAIRVKNLKEGVNTIINPIAVQRIKQDIASWRSAVRMAESPTDPQRYRMQQMYLDTVLNGHVSACLAKRTLNVLKKGIHVVDEKGNENEALTAVYNTKWMHSILKMTQEAQYYGYSLIQLGDMENYQMKENYLIRRSNINPEKAIVMPDF
jgi:hypothetical protein